MRVLRRMMKDALSRNEVFSYAQSEVTSTGGVKMTGRILSQSRAA